jgi:Right handed beta helix region
MEILPGAVHIGLSLALSAFAADAAAGQAIHFVRSGATGAGDGSSWADAFPELVPALAVAQPGDQIWIAAGAYTPAAGGIDREARFLLPSGVGLYGGFAGGELTLGQRDPATHVSALSGDLLGDDALGADHLADNSRLVVYAEGTSSGTTLDGLVVRAGHDNDPYSILPAGMKVQAGSVTLRACTFEQNSGSVGALVCNAEGTTVIDACLFRDNQGLLGTGAIKVNHAHVLDIRNSSFLGNTGAAYGGAIRHMISKTTIRNCLFSGNRTTVQSGLGSGGAALHAYGGNLEVVNCTFVNNVSAGTWTSAGCLWSYNSAVTFTNCVVWGNESGAVVDGQDEFDLVVGVWGGLTVDHCLVEGWAGQFEGWNTLGLDPLLVDPLGPDGVAGTLDDDCRLRPGSPAIDSGDAAVLPYDDYDADHDGDTVEPLPLDLRLVGRLEDDPDTADLPFTVAPVVDRGACEFSRWANLGHPLGGAKTPCLVGFGSWIPGETLGLRITGTAPHAFGFLFGGVTLLEHAFAGGVMVPFPQLALGLATDATGSLTAEVVLAPNAPSQTTLYAQVWFVDAAGPHGFTATNAVSGTVE